TADPPERTEPSLGLLVLVGLLFHRCGSFNLDVDKPSVFAGPERSYFGFSVDFFNSDILIGAPRANLTSSSTVVERGAVFTCPWSSSSSCQQVQFDTSDNRKNDGGVQMEFKSKQWFGASVRSSGDNILACAPLYQWSTFGMSEREPVGTCYLKKGSTVVEYSPCRTSGFFSVIFFSVFYWQGECLRYWRRGGDSSGKKFSSDSASFTLYFSTLRWIFQGLGPLSVGISDDVCYLVDLLVGAPLFMDRGSDGKLREVGQVAVYLSRGGFSFQLPQFLTGSEVYARYGSAIAALGDLDKDGFNDVAISAPYGGPDHNGLVYIHNGRPKGPDSSPSQVLQGKWASSYMPASFGYSMTGNTDVDQNGYPDLVVGVFGADKAVLYSPNLILTGQITAPFSLIFCSFKVKYCIAAAGAGAPEKLNFRVDLTLDRLKQAATKRALFLFSQTFQYSKNMTVENNKRAMCEEQEVFLKDEFRDKITPISVAMEYSLDYQLAADPTGLKPIVDVSVPTNVTKQAHILLDCGDDNICKPDLRLSVKSDRDQIYFGDDNALTLEVSAENQGEGAYEAELHVFPPQQADFTGVVRNSPVLTRRKTRPRWVELNPFLCCVVGQVLAELRFSVHQLSEEDTAVRFDLQIVSSNQFNNTSPRRSSITNLEVLAKVSIRGSSSPSQVLLPIANWKPKDPPEVGDDIGPQIVHVFELLNNGPSTFSKASLNVMWPYRLKNGSLLYITSFDTEGPINCTTDVEINPLNVSVSLCKTEGRNQNHVHKRDLEPRDLQSDLQTLDCTTATCLSLRCQVGRLERTKNAILFIYSRLAVDNFLRTENQNRSYVVRSKASFEVIEMPYKNSPTLPSNTTIVSMSVMWVADTAQPVPGWVVALAVLAGLLLLALLIFIMYKLGFFKRVRPPQEDCTEKEQLQPEENGNTEA
uniref:Integrin, alpha V n=1 Tax=Nothobranchius furzeri TaxID=105023 RepID=A0A8C6L6X5_NOTFU